MLTGRLTTSASLPVSGTATATIYAIGSPSLRRVQLRGHPRRGGRSILRWPRLTKARSRELRRYRQCRKSKSDVVMRSSALWTYLHASGHRTNVGAQPCLGEHRVAPIGSRKPNPLRDELCLRFDGCRRGRSNSCDGSQRFKVPRERVSSGRRAGDPGMNASPYLSF